MIKKELIRRIAASSPHLRGSDAEKTVNAVLEGITAALARGDRVEIRGIGAFTVRVRRGRPGRNPKSGVEVAVPERRFRHFRPGKPMRDRLNGASPALGRLHPGQKFSNEMDFDPHPKGQRSALVRRRFRYRKVARCPSDTS